MIAARFYLLALMLTDVGALSVKNSSKAIVKREAETSCDEDWYQFDDMCYRAKGMRLDWEQASAHCKELGGSLASIHSQELSDFLRAFILMDIQDDLWIGLNDRDNETVHVWDDGTTLDFENWGPIEEPMFLNPAKTNCVEIVFDFESKDGTSGKWDKFRCDSPREFICQKKGKKQAGNSADARFCPDGGWKHRKSCFHVVERQLSWQNSEDYCIKVFKGHLVTIVLPPVNLYLKYVLRNYTDDMWIGLKHNNEYMEKWSSGEYVIFKNWMDESIEFRNGMCAARYPSGKWEKTSCENQKSFICEVSTKSSKKTNSENSTITNSFSSKEIKIEDAISSFSISSTMASSNGVTNGISTYHCSLLVIMLLAIAIYVVNFLFLA